MRIVGTIIDAQESSQNRKPGRVTLQPTLVEDDDGMVYIDFGRVSLVEAHNAIGVSQYQDAKGNDKESVGFSIGLPQGFKITPYVETATMPRLAELAKVDKGHDVGVRLEAGGRQGNWFTASLFKPMSEIDAEGTA